MHIQYTSPKNVNVSHCSPGDVISFTPPDVDGADRCESDFIITDLQRTIRGLVQVGCVRLTDGRMFWQYLNGYGVIKCDAEVRITRHLN